MNLLKTIAKPKCLVVDDLKENIIALESLLKDEYLEIISATSGVEALNLLLEHDFALALVDVQMPGMDGFELAEIMRSTGKTRGIPLIFVTATSADNHRIFEGYEKGAVDFLQKPLSPQIVLSKVRIFLELYNQKARLQRKLQTIKETESNLQEALKSRDEFLSICSHELKTPLTSLKMQIQYTKRLREKKGDEVALTPENMTKFLIQADRSIDRIIHLVNDMLDISRVTTGRLSLNLEKVNLEHLVLDVADRFQSILDMAGCEVSIIAQSDVVGLWDKFRIEQVIANFLINVTKYAGDAPVIIRAKKDNQYAILEVQDSGPGIAPEHQQKIFERFQRAIDSHSVSGLGLGLYICKEIIDLHQGQISVDSTLGKGSTFCVKLPLI